MKAPQFQISAGTMLSTINGQQFVILGEDGSADAKLARALVEKRQRSWWRRAVVVSARWLLSIATRGGSL